jgi:hypothetical protein
LRAPLQRALHGFVHPFVTQNPFAFLQSGEQKVLFVMNFIFPVDDFHNCDPMMPQAK